MGILQLYNTRTRQKSAFSPRDSRFVRMYVCGPTVYDYAHIGNARPVIVFDVLFRVLRRLYGEKSVIYTRNITDVDDKINARAKRDYPHLTLNEAIKQLTELTNAQFQADVAALGCLLPSFQPRATEHIEEMRALIERLVARGFAYVAADHVLFSPEKMDEWGLIKKHALRYGQLANRSLDEMVAGARVDVAPYKRGVTDFVLWKPSSSDEPGWDSPCAIATKGRPGWHIECSAMSMAKLLTPFGGGLSCEDPDKNIFDIHGGGIDLVFPHHENEMAQSCCAFGTPLMADTWMHNGFVQVEGQKMSKSLGNFITIREVLTAGEVDMEAENSPAALQKPAFQKRGQAARLAMLMTHYRQPLDWTAQRLHEAEIRLRNLLAHIQKAGVQVEDVEKEQVLDAVFEPLLDDLNTHEALSALDKAKNEASPAALAASLVFLGLAEAQDFVKRDETFDLAARGFSKTQIEAMINARLAARLAKNWPESDRLRDEIANMGIVLKDYKNEKGEMATSWGFAE